MSLDLSTLTVTDSAEQPQSARRGRPAADNPFLDVILDSWNNEQAKAVVVPNGKETNKNGEFVNIVSVVSLIRRAAAARGLGVRIEVVEKSATKSEIRFMAKEKTNRPRKTKDGEQENDEQSAA